MVVWEARRIPSSSLLAAMMARSMAWLFKVLLNVDGVMIYVDYELLLLSSSRY